MQATFALWQELLLDDDHFIEQVKALVKQNLSTEKASVDNIAKRFHVSGKTLQRRLAKQQ